MHIATLNCIIFYSLIKVMMLLRGMYAAFFFFFGYKFMRFYFHLLGLLLFTLFYKNNSTTKWTMQKLVYMIQYSGFFQFHSSTSEVSKGLLTPS